MSGCATHDALGPELPPAAPPPGDELEAVLWDRVRTRESPADATQMRFWFWNTNDAVVPLLHTFTPLCRGGEGGGRPRPGVQVSISYRGGPPA